MSTQAAAVVPAASSRVAFVDLLRCLAAFQMIQGHTIAAVLAPEHRHGLVHALWQQARGLTSVAFLFASGFAFYVTTHRGGEHATTAPGVAARRFRRGVELVVIGYALHLPLAWWSSSDAAVRAAAVRGFVAVDVLQCIGVSLIVLQALSTVWRSRGAFVLGSAAVVTLALALVPWAAQVRVTGVWSPLLHYVSPLGGSPFPLVPWAAHMFAGACCAAWVTKPSAWSVHVRLLGAACGVLGLALGMQAAFGRGLVPMHLMRLSLVILLSAGLSLASAHMRKAPRVVHTLAGHTLPLYVLHILVVYGHGVGLSDSVGTRLSPGPAIALAGLVLALSVGAVLGYAGFQSARSSSTSRPPGVSD